MTDFHPEDLCYSLQRRKEREGCKENQILVWKPPRTMKQPRCLCTSGPCPRCGDRGFLMRHRQRKVPVAGMARSYTGEKRACITLTVMAAATPNNEKTILIHRLHRLNGLKPKNPSLPICGNLCNLWIKDFVFHANFHGT